MGSISQWVHASDWHWFAVFVITQIACVSAFLWFAVWISEFAKLNWY